MCSMVKSLTFLYYDYTSLLIKGLHRLCLFISPNFLIHTHFRAPLKFSHTLALRFKYPIVIDVNIIRMEIPIRFMMLVLYNLFC